MVQSNRDLQLILESLCNSIFGLPFEAFQCQSLSLKVSFQTSSQLTSHLNYQQSQLNLNLPGSWTLSMPNRYLVSINRRMFKFFLKQKPFFKTFLNDIAGNGFIQLVRSSSINLRSIMGMLIMKIEEELRVRNYKKVLISS